MEVRQDDLGGSVALAFVVVEVVAVEVLLAYD